jgi:RNase P/RNase MRP subunit p30
MQRRDQGIKKNEIMSFAGKWMELEIVMSSKISHS